MFMSSHFQLLRDLIRHYLFFDQLAGCHNWGTMGTDGMNWLATLRDNWPFVGNFFSRSKRISNFENQTTGCKVSHFQAGY